MTLALILTITPLKIIVTSKISLSILKTSSSILFSSTESSLFPVLLAQGSRNPFGRRRGSRVSFCFRPRFKDFAEEIDSQRTDVEDRKKLLDRIYDNSKQGNQSPSPVTFRSRNRRITRNRH